MKSLKKLESVKNELFDGSKNFIDVTRIYGGRPATGTKEPKGFTGSTGSSMDYGDDTDFTLQAFV